MEANSSIFPCSSSPAGELKKPVESTGVGVRSARPHPAGIATDRHTRDEIIPRTPRRLHNFLTHPTKYLTFDPGGCGELYGLQRCEEGTR